MTTAGRHQDDPQGRAAAGGSKPQVRHRLRVAAYGVCVRDGQLLLAHWLDAAGQGWTMPGGGVEHGEDPLDAVVREVAEETGYRVAVERLLGIDSFRDSRLLDTGVLDDFQGLRIVYQVRVVGGELRFETGGSTDRAAWTPLARVPELDRVDLVDIALRLHRERPGNGRLAPRAEPSR